MAGLRAAVEAALEPDGCRLAPEAARHRVADQWERLEPLLAEPEGKLTTVLTYHLIPQRYDAQGLVDAGSVQSVQGMVEITGTPDAPVINGSTNVACGNIPTANATVFVIDSVLMPPAA